jgi:hypothetical protein
MPGLEVDTDTVGLKHRLQRICYLPPNPLLDSEPFRKETHETGEL